MTPTPTPVRYDRISRWLHWGMAGLFAWIFVSAGAHALAERSALDALLWPTHKPVGTLLLALLLARVAWALARRRRPPAVSALARLGHLGLYEPASPFIPFPVRLVLLLLAPAVVVFLGGRWLAQRHLLGQGR